MRIPLARGSTRTAPLAPKSRSRSRGPDNIHAACRCEIRRHAMVDSRHTEVPSRSGTQNSSPSTCPMDRTRNGSARTSRGPSSPNLNTQSRRPATMPNRWSPATNTCLRSWPPGHPDSLSGSNVHLEPSRNGGSGRRAVGVGCGSRPHRRRSGCDNVRGVGMQPPKRSETRAVATVCATRRALTGSGCRVSEATLVRVWMTPIWVPVPSDLESRIGLGTRVTHAPLQPRADAIGRCRWLTRVGVLLSSSTELPGHMSQQLVQNGPGQALSVLGSTHVPAALGRVLKAGIENTQYGKRWCTQYS